MKKAAERWLLLQSHSPNRRSYQHTTIQADCKRKSRRFSRLSAKKRSVTGGWTVIGLGKGKIAIFAFAVWMTGPGIMLPKRHIGLHQVRFRVDQFGMRHVQPPSESPSQLRPQALVPPNLTARELAHELNSLLDGSMRSLGQARRVLEHAAAVGSGAGSENDLTTAAAKLMLVEEAMNGMAELIAQSLRDVTSIDELRTDRLLRDEIDRCLAAVSSLAEEHGVELVTHVSAAAGDLPAGALGTVLLNGLRNAVQAAALGAGPNSLRRVELSIEVNARRQLVVLISDTGPGVPYERCEERHTGAVRSSSAGGGHGIGLDLSRRIVSSLGGSLHLVNVPFGAGAVLRAFVPLNRLIER